MVHIEFNCSIILPLTSADCHILFPILEAHSSFIFPSLITIRRPPFEWSARTLGNEDGKWRGSTDYQQFSYKNGISKWKRWEQSPNKILKWKPSARRRRGEVARPCLKPPTPPPSPTTLLPSTTLPTRGVFIPRFSFHQWATCLFSDFAASSAAENNNNEKQKGKTERKKKKQNK